MCLLVLAWKAHPRYRLVLAGNRDEFHDRPAAALGWWQEDARVLAGRDLRAGGTWLGAARNGRIGVVTNFRDVDAPVGPAPSRGELVPRFLTAATSPKEFLDDLRSSAPRYSGFNLLLGGPRALYYFSNKVDAPPRALPPGIYGLSNHALDTPWPKLERVREAFHAAVTWDDLDPNGLFSILGDRAVADDAELPSTGLPHEWERALSAPFVVHERYGTRCATVVLVERDGRSVLAERRFDAQGVQTGAGRFEFTSTDAPDAWHEAEDPDDPARPDPTFDQSPE